MSTQTKKRKSHNPENYDNYVLLNQEHRISLASSRGLNSEIMANIMAHKDPAVISVVACRDDLDRATIIEILNSSSCSLETVVNLGKNSNLGPQLTHAALSKMANFFPEFSSLLNENVNEFFSGRTESSSLVDGYADLEAMMKFSVIATGRYADTPANIVKCFNEVLKTSATKPELIEAMSTLIAALDQSLAIEVFLGVSQALAAAEINRSRLLAAYSGGNDICSLLEVSQRLDRLGRLELCSSLLNTTPLNEIETNSVLDTIIELDAPELLSDFCDAKISLTPYALEKLSNNTFYQPKAIVKLAAGHSGQSSSTVALIKAVEALPADELNEEFYESVSDNEMIGFLRSLDNRYVFSLVGRGLKTRKFADLAKSLFNDVFYPALKRSVEQNESISKAEADGWLSLTTENSAKLSGRLILSECPNLSSGTILKYLLAAVSGPSSEYWLEHIEQSSSLLNRQLSPKQRAKLLGWLPVSVVDRHDLACLSEGIGASELAQSHQHLLKKRLTQASQGLAVASRADLEKAVFSGDYSPLQSKLIVAETIAAAKSLGALDRTFISFLNSNCELDETAAKLIGSGSTPPKLSPAKSRHKTKVSSFEQIGRYLKSSGQLTDEKSQQIMLSLATLLYSRNIVGQDLLGLNLAGSIVAGLTQYLSVKDLLALLSESDRSDQDYQTIYKLISEKSVEWSQDHEDALATLLLREGGGRKKIAKELVRLKLRAKPVRLSRVAGAAKPIIRSLKIDASIAGDFLAAQSSTTSEDIDWIIEKSYYKAAKSFLSYPNPSVSNYVFKYAFKKIMLEGALPDYDRLAELSRQDSVAIDNYMSAHPTDSEVSEFISAFGFSPKIDENYFLKRQLNCLSRQDADMLERAVSQKKLHYSESSPSVIRCILDGRSISPFTKKIILTEMAAAGFFSSSQKIRSWLRQIKASSTAITADLSVSIARTIAQDNDYELLMDLLLADVVKVKAAKTVLDQLLKDRSLATATAKARLIVYLDEHRAFDMSAFLSDRIGKAPKSVRRLFSAALAEGKQQAYYLLENIVKKLDAVSGLKGVFYDNDNDLVEFFLSYDYTSLIDAMTIAAVLDAIKDVGDLLSSVSNQKRKRFFDDSFLTSSTSVARIRQDCEEISGVYTAHREEIKETVSQKDFGEISTLSKLKQIVNEAAKLLRYDNLLIRDYTRDENLWEMNNTALTDGLVFIMPKDRHTLVSWGDQLGICIGSHKNYADAAASGKIILAAAADKSGSVKYCIEIIRASREVVQCNGKANKSAPADIKAAFIRKIFG